MDPLDLFVHEPRVVDRDEVELLVEAVFDGGSDPCVGASAQPREFVKRLPRLDDAYGRRALQARCCVLALGHGVAAAADQAADVATGADELAVQVGSVGESANEIWGGCNGVFGRFVRDLGLGVQNTSEVQRVGEPSEVYEHVVLGLDRAGYTRQRWSLDDPG